MEKMTKDEFKKRMRGAEIEKRIKEADTKPIDDIDADIEKPQKRDPWSDPIGAENHKIALRIKAEMNTDKPKRKPGRPKKEQVAAAPKKRGRKPKAEKLQEAAVQIASKTMDEAIDKAAKQEESLRFLIGIARGRTSEIIHNAEAHIKTADKLTDLANVYDEHIRRVEEMIK